MDEKGVRRPSATTAMKAPEHGGLLRTDKAVTTCRLPLRYHGVEYNTRKLTKSGHHAHSYRVLEFLNVATRRG